MSVRNIYLSHPQVLIDPDEDITKWGLNDIGRQRIVALADSGALDGMSVVISSAETKAVETSSLLSGKIGCEMVIREAMHENDRSATGYLPSEEFEATADQFFSEPTRSVRGWETAIDAQTRIVSEVRQARSDFPNGPILFVGHGAVGTLLYCHLAGLPISREYDQLPGGGCYFEFENLDSAPMQSWQSLETLHRSRAVE